MTKSKLSAKRVTALALCMVMMVSIFAMMPLSAQANPPVRPTGVAYDPNIGFMTWAATADPLFEIRALRDGVFVPIGQSSHSAMDVRLLNTQPLPLNWTHAVEPSFLAHVVAGRQIPGTVNFEWSAPSDSITITPVVDNTLRVTPSINGNTLSWTPAQGHNAAMIYRIYVNGILSASVVGVLNFNLLTLNLPAQSNNTVTVRTANPSTFAMSPHSDVINYIPIPGFAITVSATEGGTVQSPASAAAGTQVTLTAVPTPNTGAVFTHWEVLAPAGALTLQATPTVTFAMPANPVNIVAHFTPGVTGSQNVIVTRNNNAWGTAVANPTVAQPGSWVQVTAVPAAGYRFVRWEVPSGNVAIPDWNNATTLFQMPAQPVVAVQVRAIFEPGAATVVTGGNLGQVSISHTQVGGNVTLDLPFNRVTDLINATTAGGTVQINATGLTSVETVIVPRAAITQLATANFNLEIRLPQNLVINFNRAALTSLAAQGTAASMEITFHVMGRAGLSLAQLTHLTTFDIVYNYRLGSGGQPIHNIDGIVTLVVPFAGQTPVAAWMLQNDGRLDTQQMSFNASARTVTFAPPHPFLYVVGHQPATTTPPPPPPNDPSGGNVIPPLSPPTATNPFSDVRAGDWFYNDVMFVFGNRLMGATQETPFTFSPNVNITRALLVTILYRLMGAPEREGTGNPFSDIGNLSNEARNAVLWASDNGIVLGFPDGTFRPNALILRQDIAVILHRFTTEFLDTTIPAPHTYPNFVDQNTIQPYARPAVRWAVESGIIAGMDGNRMVPMENTTRAQIAAMIQRLVRAIP